MKISTSLLKIILLMFISIQLSMSESVKLNNGTLFEAKVYSVENGFHVFEIPKSQIIQIKYKNKAKDKDYISFISNTNISTDIIKFVNGNYYIKIKNSEISTIGNITTIGEDDLLAGTKVVKSPTSNSSFFLRIHGSNTIGAKLAPALIKAHLTTPIPEQLYLCVTQTPQNRHL